MSLLPPKCTPLNFPLSEHTLQDSHGASPFESTSVMYKYFETLSNTSTSTLAEIKSILKYCQVLSNVYINVFKLVKLLTFGT